MLPYIVSRSLGLHDEPLLRLDVYHDGFRHRVLTSHGWWLAVYVSN
jgi:hypothetical protein